MSKTLQEIYKELQDKQVQFVQEKKFPELQDLSWEVQELLNQDPENPSIIFLLGTILLNLGCFGAAVSLMTRVSQLAPSTSEAYNNLGAAWKQLHRVDKARVALQRSLQLVKTAEALNNMSTLYINMGDPQGGIPYAEESVRIAGAGEMMAAQPEWNLGLLQLELGQLEAGFKNFDAGLISGDRILKTFHTKCGTLKMWDGTPGQTVVVYDEQGLGDRIMFANLLRNVLKTNRVIMECHPRLEGLYRRSFPDLVEVWPTAKDQDAEWHRDCVADAFIPSGSLPRLYWRSYEDVDRTPYLVPDSGLVRDYRWRLLALGPGPYIGIGWRGGVHKTHAGDRSTKLGFLKPWLKTKATFVSLQYTEEAGEKLARYNQDAETKIHDFPILRDGHTTYDETAALVANLDLCVVPNTTIVHLCGAMGKECWTFTPINKAWRYCGPSPEAMPWYGDWVRQFPQAPGEDQAQWLDRITRALYERFGEADSSGAGSHCYDGKLAMEGA